jgi:hypothetical protein
MMERIEDAEAGRGAPFKWPDIEHMFDVYTDAIAASPSPIPDAPGGREEFTPYEAWNELVSKDDRTSPEEYPEMCLIAFDELCDFMARAMKPQDGGNTVANEDISTNPAPRLHAFKFSH